MRHPPEDPPPDSQQFPSVANRHLPGARTVSTPGADKDSGAGFPGPGVPRVIHHMNLGKGDFRVERERCGPSFPGSILCWGG
jgi:hypothetical protein